MVIGTFAFHQIDGNDNRRTIQSKFPSSFYTSSLLSRSFQINSLKWLWGKRNLTLFLSFWRVARWKTAKSEKKWKNLVGIIAYTKHDIQVVDVPTLCVYIRRTCRSRIESENRGLIASDQQVRRHVGRQGF